MQFSRKQWEFISKCLSEDLPYAPLETVQDRIVTACHLARRLASEGKHA